MLSKLYLVRPNLGKPLILKPEQLQSFEITVATKSTTRYSAAQIITKVNMAMPKIARQDKKDQWFPLTAQRLVAWKTIPKFTANYSQQILPVTNTDHQYTRGFRSEYKIQVGLHQNYIAELRRLGPWPILCHLEYTLTGPQKQTVHNMHAIYVHETLGQAKDFTIYQLTDTHIAHRNDLIPELLSQVRTAEECDDLKKKYVNFNGTLRSAIKSINQRVKQGEKAIVVITGDLIDYYYDGFWDGEFIWKKGKAIGWEKCNFHKFHQIITGSDHKGQALLCPVYTILGNHDYLIHENLPNIDLTILNIKYRDRDTYEAFGLSPEEGREYCYWAYPKKNGNPPSLPERKTHKGNADIKLDTNHAYWLGKPHCDHFGYYIEKINYDMDYTVTIGQQQLVCLNTGPDRYGTKEQFRDYLFEPVPGVDAPEYVHDYIAGGPHNRGITGEHINLVKAAMNNRSAQGAVMIFTHAPLVGLHMEPTPAEGYELLYEDVHSRAAKPPNQVSEFLAKVLGLKNNFFVYIKKEKILQEHGFPLYKERYFRRGPRDPELNFSCAESVKGTTYLQLFQLIRRPASNVAALRPVVVFSGHTHKAHEFRIEGPKTPQEMRYSGYYYFADDYTRKISKLKTLAAKWQWLKKNSPLLLTSGGMKNGYNNKLYAPHYREIKIKDNKLESMEKCFVTRIPLTSNLTPGCRNIALRAPNGRYVCAENGGNGNLVANRTSAREWETFELFQWSIYFNAAKFDNVALRSYNGKYLRAEDGGGKDIKADKSHIKTHETFKMIAQDKNKVVFKTYKGYYVGIDAHERLVAKSKNAGSAAAFAIKEN